ncbi:hypothetical protein SLV14_001920 [Streptomyces sp. Je 1-4]|uniref:hypothetical protein n=1 Tax=Streptomyces TaxID=1883 RepID=UPI0021D8F818|nr:MULTISPECIES: hypothetical protein [unclassified Streptomyces]UYB39427.1 hypothetical protein SLV14_001920 [Streptomyces sp. Je 1-4]UZQ35457.1 hypothetical protein SLV14N_001920 [Streptomyces sp. Je 1-4] [Streptomyces sp. Je 1-4 4N24]UZQ42875.1 hypothetical protein SLV14NA_001920 [Streptomyces sp. Je 1-4] [Streptomyces sp. Je 1-4 4N24_ara]
MNHTTRFALRLALSLADPATAEGLAERLRPELPAVLADRFGLPKEMIEELLGGDAAQMRAALFIEPGEWLLGAAELGDPAVGRALWYAVFRDDEDDRRRAMNHVPGLPAALLDAADLTDPRWYEDDGLFPVLCNERVGSSLVPLLTSGFPGVNVVGLALFGVHLPPPVVVDACIGLLELWGSTEPFTQLLELAEEIPALESGHPWLSELLRQAIDAPDPESLLRAHRPEGEWADPEHLRAMLELRYGDGPAVRPDGLDWDLIRREHERLPLGKAPGHSGNYGPGLLRLTRWEGCPADLVRESFRHNAYQTAWQAADLPFEFLAEAAADDIPLSHVLKRGIGEGRLSPHRVLTELTPAADILRALPYDHEPTRKAVADLVAPLGADPVNWLTYYDRMRRFPRNSVAALVADVTGPASRKKRCTSWPRPRKAQFPPGHTPEESRAAFLGMLECAPEEVQIAVVPSLDPLAVQQFLLEGNPSPAVRDAVAAAHGLPAQLAMAAGAVREEKLEYLLDLDEPAVDAQLFRDHFLDRSERARLLAGRLRGGGIRPVSGELLAELDGLVISQDRDMLLAGLESGDLNVARRILDRLRLYLPAGRLRLLSAVWERGGPDAVREILAMNRLPVTLRRWTEKLLDVPDGLERLRARLAEEAAPERLAAYLTRPGDRPDIRLNRLLSEGMELPWPALVTAHRAGPLSADLVTTLVTERPDCPRELLLAGLANAPERWGSWIEAALRNGSLTLEDLLDHTAPAEAALDLLHRYRYGHPDDRFPDEMWRPVRERAAALVREHLGTDVEAWSVFLRLLPTFVGTLPELAATAGAVTRVPA